MPTQAKTFARTVKPGHTYYARGTHHYPWGNEVLLTEWTFGTKRCLITAELKSGHMAASAVWDLYGPLYNTRPPGLLTVTEYSQLNDHAPTRADLAAAVAVLVAQQKAGTRS
jgi:hypothetical protein